MVWCSRPIWAFLDDHQPGEGSGYVGLDTAIEIWNEARTGLNLGGVPNIYWPHDCDEESVLPKGLEGGFVDRLDALVASLELRRARRGGTDRAKAFDPRESEHETLALGAALWVLPRHHPRRRSRQGQGARGQGARPGGHRLQAP